jgi:exoribonuclease R
MLNNRAHTSADVDLRGIAKRAMLDRGFLIQVPEEAQSQLKIEREPAFESLKLPDLTSWLWSSIDNDDSRDLDQIEYAKKEKAGTRIYIGVADVDWFVPRNTALDHAAQHNTTSVYTGIMTFPMLPEQLSTDLSSLNENVRRLAMVIEMLVGVDGAILESSVYPAVVQNHAQLTYNAVAAWLEGKQDSSKDGSDITARVLEKIIQHDELADQLKLQNEVAEQLRERRHLAGALSLETTELHIHIPRHRTGDIPIC